MARSCHAWRVNSTGRGTMKRRMRPIEMERIKGMSFAPVVEGGCFVVVVVVVVVEEEEDAAALRGLREEREWRGFGEEERER